MIAVAVGSEIVNEAGLGEEDVIEAEASMTAETVIGSVVVDVTEIVRRSPNLNTVIETVVHLHLQLKSMTSHLHPHLQMNMERRKKPKRIQKQKQKHNDASRR